VMQPLLNGDVALPTLIASTVLTGIDFVALYSNKISCSTYAVDI